MSATLFSLISVTVAFAGLVLWVYWPSRRERIEALGQIPLEPDDTSARPSSKVSQSSSSEDTQEHTEQRQ